MLLHYCNIPSQITNSITSLRADPNPIVVTSQITNSITSLRADPNPIAVTGNQSRMERVHVGIELVLSVFSNPRQEMTASANFHQLRDVIE